MQLEFGINSLKRIVSVAKKIKSYLFFLRHVPICVKFKKVGIYTHIDKRYVSIVGAEYIEIGNGCNINANLRIEAISKYKDKCYRPTIIIEDNVYINQNFHCTCASSIIIGKGTSITANCGIFDIIHPYKDIYSNPRENEINTLPIRIGKNCLIGMNSVILPGVILGDHVVVGANSTVTSGIYPSNCVLCGSPAKMIKMFDSNSKEWISL